ncbi:MAG: sulfurtransferase [Algicola sp.]|nr:sulfurtransferase [Algicola sp.]
MLKNGRLVSPLVDCSWLHEHLELEKLVILNASMQPDADLFIPNSRNVDVKQKLSDVNALFPNTLPSREQFQKEVRALGINTDSIVIVYDDKGIYWSPRVWWLFKTFGYNNVAVLNGGLPEWKKQGYTTVAFSGNRKTWNDGNFVANYKPEHMRFYEDMAEISKDETSVILDARSEDRFCERVPEPREGLRRGSIPNSKNLPYSTLFDGHILKSKEALKAIFETYKLNHRTIVFSCGSGITACILALAADIVGYNNKAVYDGSWTEYGTLNT